MTVLQNCHTAHKECLYVWKVVKLNVLITKPYYFLFGNSVRFSGYIMSKGAEIAQAI
jgi:hypothetical protein